MPNLYTKLLARLFNNIPLIIFLLMVIVLVCVVIIIVRIRIKQKQEDKEFYENIRKNFHSSKNSNYEKKDPAKFDLGSNDKRTVNDTFNNKRIKCLHQMNYNSLCKLVENTLQITKWYIRDMNIHERTNKICCSDRFLYLKHQAEKKNLCVDDTEIVTWLDSLMILYYVFQEINRQHLKNSIQIIQEYCIPYSNKRADYLLTHKNKILILEFSFRQAGHDYQYETKSQQANEYKEILKKQLSNQIEIKTYTFLIKPEENKYGYSLTKEWQNLPNERKIKKLANFIENIFNDDKDFALNELENL